MAEGRKKRARVTIGRVKVAPKKKKPRVTIGPVSVTPKRQGKCPVERAARAAGMRSADGQPRAKISSGGNTPRDLAIGFHRKRR